MKPLNHDLVQQMLRSGNKLLADEQAALSEHLSSCAECQTYAAFVAELSGTLPALFPSNAISWQAIRQKAVDSRSLLQRRSRITGMLRGLRTSLLMGGSLAILLLLTVVVPKLLPVQPVGSGEATPTFEGTITPLTTPQPTTTLVPLPTAPLSDVLGVVRLASPDRQFTAIFHPMTRELEIVDVMGRPISSYPSQTDGMILGPWSPDSQQLVFWLGRQDSSLSADGLPMWLLDVQTGQASQVSELALPNKAYQSWSPDSKTLAFTNGGYRSAQIGKRLSLYHVETNEITEINQLPTTGGLITGAVAWSPAGDLIAVAAVESSQTGTDYADYMGWNNPAIAARRIYVVNPQNSAYQPLTLSDVYEDAPLWNLDGSRLYFVQQADANARLMMFDLGTTRLEALPDCEIPMPPSAEYYGQVDWSDLFTACGGADGLLPFWTSPGPQETMTTEETFCAQVEQNHQPAPGFRTYCDVDYSFALDIPQDWAVQLISSAPDETSGANTVRKVMRFEEDDMNNFVRTDTYRLYVSMNLEQRMRRFFSYDKREFPDKDYPSLMIGGRPAYAILNRWEQDISAVYLFFEHGDYFTVLELKAPARAALYLNWEIARSIQVPYMGIARNNIPAELIEDSYTLLEPSAISAATKDQNSFSVGFSADGSILAFNSSLNSLTPDDQAGLMDPFIYNLENDTYTLVRSRLGVQNTVSPATRAVSLSANGRYLLYGARSNSPQPTADHYNYIYLRDLQTGQDEKIDFVPLEAQLGEGIYPSLSPDGRYLALQVAKDTGQIYLLERASGKITPVSMDGSGRMGNGSSVDPVFSADGHYLAFTSEASNLASGDARCSETNLRCVDVFLYGISTGKLERIPAQIQFTMGNPYSYLTVSADARWLAWTELITPSPVYRPIIRLHDRTSGETRTIWAGLGAYLTGHSPSISNDGRWLAFGALSDFDYDLKPFPDSYPQVYLLDLQTNERILISADSNHNEGIGPSGVVSLQQEGWSSDIHISGDGRYVAFSSQAANLLPPGVKKRQCNDPIIVGAYACYDLFVYDRETQELSWISQAR